MVYLEMQVFWDVTCRLVNNNSIDTAKQTRRAESSATPLQKPQTSHVPTAFSVQGYAYVR
jgi:hypothetical protein